MRFPSMKHLLAPLSLSLLCISNISKADQWTAVGQHTLDQTAPNNPITSTENIVTVYTDKDRGYGSLFAKGFYCLMSDGSVLVYGSMDEVYDSSRQKGVPDAIMPAKHIAFYQENNYYALSQNNQIYHVELNNPHLAIVVPTPPNLPMLSSVHRDNYHLIGVTNNGSLISWKPESENSMVTAIPSSPVKKLIVINRLCYLLLQNNKMVVWDYIGGTFSPLETTNTDFKGMTHSRDDLFLISTNGTVEAKLYRTSSLDPVLASLTKVSSLAIGNEINAAVHDDGSITAWGENEILVTQLTALEQVKTVTFSHDEAFVIYKNGSSRLFSSYTKPSQLVPLLAGITDLTTRGDLLTYSGSLISQIQPTKDLAFDIPTSQPGIKSFTGGRHTLVITNADGSITSFGRQQGIECVTPQSAINIKKVSAKWDNVLALNLDGDVIPWEANRLGLDEVNNLPKAKDLEVGGIASIIITEDDYAVTFGFFLSKTPATLGKVKKVSCGFLNAAAIALDGTVSYWGLATGSPTEWKLEGAVDCELIALSGNHGYAVNSSGELLSWDMKFDSYNLDSRVAEVVVGGENLVEISDYAHGIIGKRADGTVIQVEGTKVIRRPELDNMPFVVGHYLSLTAVDAAGHLQTFEPEFLSETPAPAATPMSKIFDNGFGIDTSGQLHAWGIDSWGILQIPNNLSSVQKAVRTPTTALALLQNGTIATWGSPNSFEAIIPSNLTNIVDIDCGEDFVVALKNDGSLTAWGQNNNGQLDIPSSIPQATQVACGGQHTLALTQSGEVVAWGANDQGQSTVPSNLTNVIKVTAGKNHSAAMKSDGSVITWGANFSSEIQVPTWTGPITDIKSNYDSFATYYRFGPSGQSTYDQLQQEITIAGLTNQDAELNAKPHTDKISNLIKWASNLNLDAPDHRILDTNNQTAGQPSFSTISTSEGPVFQFQFLRRKTSKLIYQPQFSTDLQLYQEMKGTTTVEPIDDNWEKVTITKPLSPTSPVNGFGKLKVTLP